MIKMFGTKLVILGLASVSTGQDLTCPTGVAKPSTFYVIGASGGDIKVKYSLYLNCSGVLSARESPNNSSIVKGGLIMMTAGR